MLSREVLVGSVQDCSALATASRMNADRYGISPSTARRWALA